MALTFRDANPSRSFAKGAGHPAGYWLGVFRLADPKITLASLASMIVGASAAAFRGPLDWAWLALTVAGIFCIEAAKNASGEVVDWDSGADVAVSETERTPFSGGKRVIVEGLLSRGQTAWLAFVFYTLGIGAGLAIARWREPGVLGVGLVGIGLAFFYHARPLRLSYRGLGELAVAIAYGPAIASGTYLVQRHRLDDPTLLASLPLGLAIMAFLWINEFPDARADALAGKQTLVVRLGRSVAARAFVAILVLAWLGVVLLPAAGLPRTIWLALIGLPPAVAASRHLLRWAGEPRELIRAQTQTLASFVLMALGLGAGLVAGMTSHLR